MNSVLRWLACLVGLVGVAGLIGCGSSETTRPVSVAEEHEHEHEHDGESHEDNHAHAESESLADAVATIERLRSSVQESFAAGELDEADGPVHEVGHLLEELPELAAGESLSAIQQEQVKQAVDSLMDSFAALDERLHGGSDVGKSYDEVAAQIEEALAELKTVCQEESAP